MMKSKQANEIKWETEERAGVWVCADGNEKFQSSLSNS